MATAGQFVRDRDTAGTMRSFYYDIRTAGPAMMTVDTPLRRVKFAFATFAEGLDGDTAVAITCEINSSDRSQVFVKTTPPVIKNVVLHVVGNP